MVLRGGLVSRGRVVGGLVLRVVGGSGVDDVSDVASVAVGV